MIKADAFGSERARHADSRLNKSRFNPRSWGDSGRWKEKRKKRLTMIDDIKSGGCKKTRTILGQKEGGISFGRDRSHEKEIDNDNICMNLVSPIVM